MQLHGIKPKNHINSQKEYIRKLEEKNTKQREIKEMQGCMYNPSLYYKLCRVGIV